MKSGHLLRRKRTDLLKREDGGKGMMSTGEGGVKQLKKGGVGRNGVNKCQLGAFVVVNRGSH